MIWVLYCNHQVDDTQSEEKTDRDKNMVIMFNILRKRLESLALTSSWFVAWDFLRYLSTTPSSMTRLSTTLLSTSTHVFLSLRKSFSSMLLYNIFGSWNLIVVSTSFNPNPNHFCVHTCTCFCVYCPHISYQG